MHKITLPTPDTCRWRAAPQAEHATCGVLASLMGMVSSVAQVSLPQCEACCQSFPPTPGRLNPVTASLLFARLQIAEHPELTPGRFDQLLAIAKKALGDEPSQQPEAVPRRYWQRCCYLGTSEAAETPVPGSVPCHHPGYEWTTPEKCKRCHDWSARATISRLLKLDEIVPLARPAGKVRYWAVGVTTAPRRQPTLEPCLDGLTRAGWSDIHLFLDGTVRVPENYTHLQTTWREQSIGACPAWVLSLAELVVLHPQADAYALFQDDVLPHYGDSLREYLERALWPDGQAGVVSLYNPGIGLKPGWQVIPSEWDWGAQAVIFSPPAVRTFLSDPTVLRRMLPVASGAHLPIPELLREWLFRHGIYAYCPYPSVVQHIGVASTIWPQAKLERHRTAPWFSADLEQLGVSEQSLADFDESLFRCLPKDEPLYNQRLGLGRSRMAESTVVICGIGRDVRPFLPRTAARIERLGSMFLDYRVVLFENDSVDATPEFLHDWQCSNPRLDVISERRGLKRHAQTRDLARARALADCRNRYLERVHDRYRDFTHVIVVDLDLIGGWSYEGIANSFGHDGWDFVGSYGLDQLPVPPQHPPVRFHYDRWAFRAGPTSAAQVLLAEHRDSLRRGMPMLEVESCFGGLGIYRTPCLSSVRYGGGDCEHVVLHKHLRESGARRLFLNPSQIVCRSVLVH